MPRAARWWASAAVGAGAAMVASALMLWAGRTFDGVILAQLISERITDIVPLSVFRRVLEELESDAKPLTLAGLTLFQVLGGALIGLAYGAAGRAGRRSRLIGAAALSLAVWLFLSLVAAPLGNVGVFARNVSGDVWRTQLTFVLGALAFGVLTAAFVPWAPRAANAPEGVDESRRRFVALAGVSAVSLLSAVYVGRYVRTLRRKSPAPAVISAGDAPPTADFVFPGMPPRITPTDQFYVVSKNFVDPTVDSVEWDLEIGGMVSQPMKLSYTDLTLRPSKEFTSTLECISNSVGGDYISTGTWKGFSLKSLLDEAGLQDGVVDVELHAADGYVESIPLAEALADDTMLVHTINGEPLPSKHGFPARLIVPGIFGMKNVKWITGIFPVNNDVLGYWQERGWSDVATVQTMSRIDVPRSNAKAAINQPLRLGGVAFAGDRGISKVEVSIDDGKTWNVAELDEVISPLTWRLWQYDVTPTVEGTLSVKVRATDGRGELQTSDERETLPDGATGYHRIRVKVQAA